MRVFILDDIPQRHDNIKLYLRSRNIGTEFEWFSAQTYLEGVTQFREQGPFDLLCLDHDLGDYDPEVATRSPAATGYAGGRGGFLDGVDFCHFLRNRNTAPTDVWVHSWNPEGANRMVGLLRDDGHRVTVQPAPGEV